MTTFLIASFDSHHAAGIGIGPLLEDERGDKELGPRRPRRPEPGQPSGPDRCRRGAVTHPLFPDFQGPGWRVLRDRVRAGEGIGGGRTRVRELTVLFNSLKRALFKILFFPSWTRISMVYCEKYYRNIFQK